ncbi:phenylalanine--tRNA ligase subunit alpha [candidate division BRC1 bacterium HGW-BRC1-1]|nr:MAG: phenylalanine--tRNA ligase subunit alpha [candidate division BRC1 bacterium HGW-BRC1-1]
MSLETLHQDLDQAEQAALASVEQAGDSAAMDRLRPEVMGKKSPIRQLMKMLGGLSADERPEAGRVINEAQARVEAAFAAKDAAMKEAALNQRLETERIDVTLPGAFPLPLGALHPLTQTLNEIVRIFTAMGYDTATGPEVETEHYNFDALNFAPNHPARDSHDSFYLPGGGLLRTHTSPVQIRYMQNHKPPIQIIAPGRTFRVDDVDATHSPVFHQVEGLLVDENVSLAHLNGTLTAFARAMFGSDLATRFRASYFPFVEPGAEMDVQCWECGGKGTGCRVCKSSGWVEILGAGLVHPNVLKSVGLDPQKVSGFAFGMGVERIAMLRYGISSIRNFYENDVRFLRQFA